MLKKFKVFIYLVLFCSISFPVCFAHSNPSMLASDDNQRGWYVSGGVGAGWSSAEEKSFTEARTQGVLALTTRGNSDLIESSGIAANFTVGYLFKYFALQAGYLSVPTFIEHDTGVVFVTSSGSILGGLSSRDASSINILDVLGKMILPVKHKAQVIMGAGLAVVFKNAFTRHSTVILSNDFSFLDQAPGASTTFYRPEIVLGFGKCISKHITTQFVYTRIFGKSNIGVTNAESNFLPDINTMRLDLSYYFQA